VSSDSFIDWQRFCANPWGELDDFVVFTATKAKGLCPIRCAFPHAHPFPDPLVIRVELTLT
jgi:hypothetical protein